jgi:kynureninase
MAGQAEALKLDSSNELSRYRERFYIPPGTVYMDGNSLGLLSADAEKSLFRVLDEWKKLGIGGWLKEDKPWFHFAEEMGRLGAGLVGAEEHEVIFTGTTTLNIHNLTGTFFKPDGRRNKILADKLNFPGDLYALQGQLRLKGLDPRKHLVLAVPGMNGLLDEDSVIGLMTDDVAMVFLPSVVYRSGQLLDLEKLTAAAHDRGIVIGFDCCHSAGIVPHRLSEIGVDFALWCSYKYLNAGPGAAAFLYVNKKHHNLMPSLPGWFGQQKEKQFEMLPEFIPVPHAGRWQISTPGILGSAPVEGALKIIFEAGIEKIRETSLSLTGFLLDLITSVLIPADRRFVVLTPREDHRRGGHVALQHPLASVIYDELLRTGIITDLRPPNIIRIAPSPLYNTFGEINRVVDSLMEITSRKLTRAK